MSEESKSGSLGLVPGKIRDHMPFTQSHLQLGIDITVVNVNYNRGQKNGVLIGLKVRFFIQWSIVFIVQLW